MGALLLPPPPTQLELAPWINDLNRWAAAFLQQSADQGWGLREKAAGPDLLGGGGCVHGTWQVSGQSK